MKCDRPEIHHLLLLHLVGPNADQEPAPEVREHLAACDECRALRAAPLPVAADEAPFLDAETIARLAARAVAETRNLLADSLGSRPEETADAASLSDAALRHAERDFEILEKLGEGGQAVVYRARHRETGRLVAVKCAFAGTQWLDREARIAGRLEGDLFRRVELVAKEGYAVLELCDGSLRELLESVKGRGLPLESVRAISDRVLRALEVAHERGIVHGDFKPGNVLLKDGVSKVADFGLSLEEPDAGALIQSHTTRSSRSLAGTPQYLPPEQRRGVKADMYAFGRTLAEMLTGRSAATSASPSLLRPELGAAWDRLIANLTDEDPTKRLSAHEARAAIAAIGSEPPRRFGRSAAGCFVAVVVLSPIVALLATSPRAVPSPPPVAVVTQRTTPVAPRHEEAVVTTASPVAPPEPPANVTSQTSVPVDRTPPVVARGDVAPLPSVTTSVDPKLPPGLRVGREVGGVPVALWALPDGAGDIEFVQVRRGGQPFWLGRVAVTWRQYRAFARATRRSEPPVPSFAITDEHPVVNVSFEDALAFARWAGLALPGEDDLERAAGTKRYPWGDEAPDAGGIWRANFGPGVDASENGRDGYEHTAPVGSYAAGITEDGVADLAGNVAEWAIPLAAGENKPVLGGSWGSPLEDLERPARKLVPKGEPRQTVGFRCRVR